MRRYDADDGLVVAARKERIANVDAILFFPPLMSDEAEDVESLILARDSEIKGGRAARPHVCARDAELLYLCFVFREDVKALLCSRVKGLFLGGVFVMSEQAVRYLTSAILYKVVLVDDGDGDLVVDYLDQRENRRLLPVCEPFTPKYLAVFRDCIIARLGQGEILSVERRRYLFPYL